MRDRSEATSKQVVREREREPELGRGSVCVCVCVCVHGACMKERLVCEREKGGERRLSEREG